MHRSPASFACLAAVTTVLVWPGFVARAEPDARADDPKYVEFVDRGLQEYNAGNYPEARTFFQRAHETYPNARTLRSLAVTCYALRDYVSAMTHAQLAMQSTVRPLTPSMRTEMEKILSDSGEFVTRVRVTYATQDAKLRVDGQPGVIDDDHRLLLNPGTHEISAAADGYEPRSWSVNANGAPMALEVLLDPKRGSETVASQPPQPSPAESSLLASPAPADEPQSWWDELSTTQLIGLGCGAVAVVGVGTGIVFSVLAVNANQASAEHCDGNSCDAAGVKQRDTAATRADVATVSFIAAGALAATGITLFFAGAPSSSPEERGLRITPAVARTGVGVELSGGF